MASYSKDDLVQDVRSWLDDDQVLSKTRGFLGGQGLGEAKVANWSRPERDVPETLIEGAALYHCARSGTFDTSAAERTGLVGGRFWQVFVVGPRPDANGNHDCLVVRCWQDVRHYGERRDELFLTHKTWFTGVPDDKNPVIDLMAARTLVREVPGKPNTEGDGWTAIEDESTSSRGREIAVSWRVPREERRDYGYAVRLAGTVSTKPPKGQRHEYLGGLSTIPMEEEVLIVSLPPQLLKASGDLLDDYTFVRPQCLEFLAEGIPITVLEAFLQARLARKHLAPWFDNRGRARLWRDSGLELPPPIESLLKAQGVSLNSDDGTAFVARVVSPAPYLYYSMVFELPRAPNAR